MDSNTSVAIMFVSAFGATAVIIRALLSYRLKSRMARAGSIDNETLKLISQVDAESKDNTLKWSLLFAFAGAGMIVLQYTGCKPDEPLPYGIEAIFIGMGLFTYYMLASRKKINNIP